MKGIVYVAALCSAMLISGCVTTKEIVVGVDANGNEILRNVEGINYEKAANDRINLAVRYIQYKEMTMAKSNLELAEKYNPGTENLYLAWGYYYMTVEDYFNAEKVYKEALSKYPHSGYVLTRYGAFLCSQKKYSEADTMFLDAVKIPNYAAISSTYEEAAICSYDQGDRKRTASYFEQAMNYGGNSPSLLYNYAQFSYEEGDYQKADKLMRTFDMFEKNETAQTLFLKIKIATKLGQYSSAEIYGRTLMSKFKNTPEGTEYLKGNY